CSPPETEERRPGRAHSPGNSRKRKILPVGRLFQRPVKGKKSESDPETLDEPLHSDAYVEIIAAAFGGKSRPALSLGKMLDKIDWEATAKAPKK
ncbi:hypothetical protein KKP04_15280, partial [Rhodomicrobium sp. Az07]|uniref:hypothetical protein n=1 Tax=Rhodomicrobium sp. Az07 TaxID=2839034 RepID=UPI001BE7C85C